VTKKPGGFLETSCVHDSDECITIKVYQMAAVVCIEDVLARAPEAVVALGADPCLVEDVVATTKARVPELSSEHLLAVLTMVTNAPAWLQTVVGTELVGRPGAPLVAVASAVGVKFLVALLHGCRNPVLKLQALAVAAVPQEEAEARACSLRQFELVRDVWSACGAHATGCIRAGYVAFANAWFDARGHTLPLCEVLPVLGPFAADLHILNVIRWAKRMRLAGFDDHVALNAVVVQLADRFLRLSEEEFMALKPVPVDELKNMINFGAVVRSCVGPGLTPTPLFQAWLTGVSAGDGVSVGVGPGDGVGGLTTDSRAAQVVKYCVLQLKLCAWMVRSIACSGVECPVVGVGGGVGVGVAGAGAGAGVGVGVAGVGASADGGGDGEGRARPLTVTPMGSRMSSAGLAAPTGGTFTSPVRTGTSPPRQAPQPRDLVRECVSFLGTWSLFLYAGQGMAVVMPERRVVQQAWRTSMGEALPWDMVHLSLPWAVVDALARASEKSAMPVVRALLPMLATLPRTLRVGLLRPLYEQASWPVESVEALTTIGRFAQRVKTCVGVTSGHFSMVLDSVRDGLLESQHGNKRFVDATVYRVLQSLGNASDPAAWKPEEAADRAIHSPVTMKRACPAGDCDSVGSGLGAGSDGEGDGDGSGKRVRV
jgi:hypothetical protein